MIFNGQIPPWLQVLFPKIIFRISNEDCIFPTFDDGPDPVATPIILDILKEWNWKASFFCIAEKAELYPDIIQRIQSEGHTIGNHGYHHLDGWKMKSKSFWENEKKGRDVLQTLLFRPPYGRISIASYLKKPKDVAIVMWDILSYDYDSSISQSDRNRMFQKQLKAGSIVVFHDRENCLENCLDSLKEMKRIVEIEGLRIEALKLKT